MKIKYLKPPPRICQSLGVFGFTSWTPRLVEEGEFPQYLENPRIPQSWSLRNAVWRGVGWISPPGKMKMNSLVVEPTHLKNTVDGRNPGPVDRQSISLFTGFYTSQVVQDFFHQQYESI